MMDRERGVRGATGRRPRLLQRLAALATLLIAASCATQPGTPSTSTSSSSDSGATSPPGGGSGGGSGGFTRIARSEHPLARADLELGPLDPEKRIDNLSLVFKLSPGQVADREALLDALITPGSPHYHKWLTPEDYAARFGAKTTDIARATAWLSSQGLDVHTTVSRLGARVMFSGTVSKLESAFRAQMNRYLVRGETHFAMTPAPAIPDDLSDIVLAVHNTHDFYPRPSKPRFKVIPDAVCPSGGLCSGNGIAPPDWATIYDVNSLYTTGIAGTKITGAGVTIAIVGITEISQTDLTAFRTRYGLASNPITMTLVPGTGAAQADNGAGIEAVLDTEWSGAIAPSATINYVYTGANDGNVDDATHYAIEQNFGAVLSESWGGCEQGFTLSDADVLQVYGSAASLLGTTYVASSGDDGAAACQGTGGLYVNMPAAYPGVTAVGGTGFAIPGGLTFDGSGNVTGSGTEAVWNEFHDAYTSSGVAAGGGGISSVFTRPTYQATVPTCTSVGNLPTGVTPGSMREVPDVALTAASGSSQYAYFIECTMDTFDQDCTASGSSPVVIAIGGTSASAPSFAGVMALANQATGGRLGNVNPLLYLLDTSVPAAFRDVTTGDNEVTCKGSDPGCPAGKLYGYAAATGYDCASGLGSIDATNLVTAWATLTPTTTSLSPSATTTSEGASVTLTATVDVVGTNPNVLGGTVTFTFQSYLANGDTDLSWTLGSAPIAGGTTTSGTAAISVPIPPGLVKPGESVDLVAMYGGDDSHLASVSAKTPIAFSPIATLCVDPATPTVKAGGTIAYTAGGGVPPVLWYIDYDSTCAANGTKCSTLNETTGAFVGGTGAAGWVIVQALDADGAEVFSEVTVGSPSGTAPWAGTSGFLTNSCCTPITSCPAGDNCGTISDGCTGTVSCGPACALPQTCGGGGKANQCGCTPLTTCPAGDCGSLSDGCGGTLLCSTTCTSPQTCGGGGTPNQCGCTPATTCPAGDNCGTVPDGCGGSVSCGTCTAPQTCTGNVCSCTPKTTCPVGDNCGTVPDGCGGTVSCGTCTAPQTCTGNVCSCTPLTTCPAGDNCGTVPDGCGGTVSCGACTAPQICAGNVCVCIPLTSCPAGDNCGTVPDGCGGTVSCGTCTAPDTCSGNVCTCTPLTTCPAGDNCGSVPDGCGGTLSCGSCTAPQTCAGGGTANQCGCTPLTNCPAGDVCGTVPDGCGGTVSCLPGCTSGQTCSSNQCVTLPVDSGPDVTDSGPKTDSGTDAHVDSGGPGDSGVDARTDSGEPVDSGKDARTDSGEPVDSGHDAPTDSGSPVDSAVDSHSDSGADGGSDSGSHDSGSSDSGSAKDSGGRHDSGENDHDGAVSEDGAADGGQGEFGGGGCSCRTSKPTSTSQPALASFGALALLGVRMRRRRKP
jgi:MYXO-CTERM domain-containing protein